MWIKRSVVLALAVSLALGIGPAYAKWHFHGGNVQDIPRRIKEAIDTAKEGEVYKQVVALRDQYKEIKEVWGDFNNAITGLSDTVSNTIHEIRFPGFLLLVKTGDSLDMKWTVGINLILAIKAIPKRAGMKP